MTLIDLYVDRIQKGLMTLDQVPPRWRKQVEEALKKNGSEES